MLIAAGILLVRISLIALLGCSVIAVINDDVNIELILKTRVWELF